MAIFTLIVELNLVKKVPPEVWLSTLGQTSDPSWAWRKATFSKWKMMMINVFTTSGSVARGTGEGNVAREVGEPEERVWFDVDGPREAPSGDGRQARAATQHDRQSAVRQQEPPTAHRGIEVRGSKSCDEISTVAFSWKFRNAILKESCRVEYILVTRLLFKIMDQYHILGS